MHINSTTVYGDRADPDRCTLMYALHPTSGRWWWKGVGADLAYGHSGAPYQWTQLAGEPPSRMVRVHRQNRRVSYARAAQLPFHDQRSPWGVKHHGFSYAGEPYATAHLDAARPTPGPGRVMYHPSCRCIMGNATPGVEPKFGITIAIPKDHPQAEAFRQAASEGQSTMTTSSDFAKAQAAQARIPAGTRRIAVCFPGNSTQYTYLTQDESIAERDLVLVNSPRSGITVVRVVGVRPTVEGVQHAYEWIVDRVDPAKVQAYEDRKKQDAELKALDAEIARATRVAQSRLDERLLAQTDPDLARLLAQRDRAEGRAPSPSEVIARTAVPVTPPEYVGVAFRLGGSPGSRVRL